MKSKYGWYDCYWCLCEVCTRMHCQILHRRYKLDYCVYMIQRERCPVTKCDFFQHKEKYKVYRIVRRHKKRDILIDRLDSIEKAVNEISEKL